jgi:hypothetical protein
VLVSTHPTIEALRAELTAPDATRRFNLGEVRTVVDCVTEVRSLGEVASASGLSEAQVLEVVAELGTWLAHVRGGNAAKPVLWHRTGQLFPANRQDDEVVVPRGFERTAYHRRDVGKAIASVVSAKPTNDELGRWLARKYKDFRSDELQFPMVTSIWFFATLGRLDEIGEVSTDRVYRSLVVQAFDLLANAITVSNRAAVRLVQLMQVGTDEIVASVEEIIELTDKLAWVQPGEMARLRYLAEQVRDHPATPGPLVGRLRSTLRLMKADPDAWVFKHIGKLSQGQVAAIAANAGLDVEGTSREEEARIRTRLTTMGLKADADMLVPEGVRAVAAGNEDAFWLAMESLVAGDSDWQHLLAEAAATA